MIQCSRTLSKEEVFLFDLRDCAKSLGCTCDYHNGYDPSLGIDGVAPDHAFIMCKYNSQNIFLLEYDGWDRCEQYGNIFDRERFYIHTFNECKPFTKFKKMVNDLKKMLRMDYISVPYSLSNQNTRTIIPSIYNWDNHTIQNLRTRYDYSSVEDVKNLMKYMVSENAVNLKLRDNYIKKLNLTEDFE